MKKLQKIIDAELCLGCGMCQSILGKENCSMKLNAEGRYYPHIKVKANKFEQARILKICPSVCVKGTDSKTVWGKVIEVFDAWSFDEDIRRNASSGGVISALCIYMIEHKLVDSILQIGVRNDSYLYNELKVSKTRNDILNNASSRYAPALVFHNILEIFKSNEDIYAFVGKPCDIACLKNFLEEYPEFSHRVKYFISIFCAGMPSYEGTKELLKLSKHIDEPVSLRYRGDGWPGYFKAYFKDNTYFKVSYNDSWGKVLNKYLNFRCKICPDGIGLSADIAVGDSWETKDGYPNFEEKEGRSFITYSQWATFISWC